MGKEILRSQTEVLTWLQERYPQIHAVAELERDWVWLPADLRGCGVWKGCECEKCKTNKAVRTDLKEFGFHYHRGGGHPLPSGALGTWAHSCEKPIPFRRRGGGKKESGKDAGAGRSDLDAEIAAALAL